MPTKLLDGSPGPRKVSSATATPLRLEKPSPPPAMPMLFGDALDASNNAKVRPSAPVPPPIDVVNLADRPLLGTGAEKTADPTRSAVAGVSTSCEPLIVAEPLSFQAPLAGLGTALPLAGVPRPVTSTWCAPAPSSELITYCPVAVPVRDGTKVTGMWSLLPGARTSPSASGALTSNGAAGGAALVIVTLRLPVLETVSTFVADESTSTRPNETEGGSIVRRLTPTTPFAFKVATPDPSAPTNVIDDSTAPVVFGANVTDTATEANGGRTVPTLGRPATANADDGGTIAAIFSFLVPVLVTLSVNEIVEFSGTSPKSSVGGVAVNPGLTDRPCNATPNVSFFPPLVTVSDPTP